ncbi:MAG TPA: FAD-binding oxidoreductase [Bryobacteraceae bacterium]|nr:FAD-binding oxidoreductase [Bryobacteraceae bacterium]
MSSRTLLSRRNLFCAGAGIVSLRSRLRAQAAISSIEKLRNSLKGSLIVPTDPAYDAARRLASFNPTTDKHPQLIVRCAEAGDAAIAMKFAREHELEAAVRSGGHDVLGASVCDGMVIDLSPLKAIRIDPEHQLARVEPGARSGELNAAGQRYGLAAALGCHPGVGVGGLTLGGGLGWLLGKHGATCDNLTGAELVTSDGRMMRASEEENPDLFWALRGGGGNFGIVTALDFRLHPLDQVFGGVLVLRADVARFLHFYGTFMQAAPDELAVEISVVPGEQPAIIAMACFSGDAAEGERVLKPLRSFGTRLADWIDRVAYPRVTSRMSEVGSLLGWKQQASGPGFNYWRGGSLRELSDAAAGQIAAAIEHAPAGCSLGLGHYMHGQICRVAADATPLIRTPGQVTYFINASWGEPKAADAKMEWVERTRTAMKPASSEGAYINYLSEDSPAAVKASYGSNYDRLRQVKRRYDPSNFFHRNRNIRA